MSRSGGRGLTEVSEVSPVPSARVNGGARSWPRGPTRRPPDGTLGASHPPRPRAPSPCSASRLRSDDGAIPSCRAAVFRPPSWIRSTASSAAILISSSVLPRVSISPAGDGRLHCVFHGRAPFLKGRRAPGAARPLRAPSNVHATSRCCRRSSRPPASGSTRRRSRRSTRRRCSAPHRAETSPARWGRRAPRAPPSPSA